jgi:hypothetical protein
MSTSHSQFVCQKVGWDTRAVRGSGDTALLAVALIVNESTSSDHQKAHSSPVLP